MRTKVIFYISILSFLLLPCIGTAQQSREQASFEWKNLPLRTAIDSLMQWYSKSIVFLDEDVDGVSINAECSDCSFDKAIQEILRGTSLLWIRRGNQVILKKDVRSDDETLITVSGIITDSLSGERIAGAVVILTKENTLQAGKINWRWCTTNGFGFFSFPRTQLGTYKFEVKAIGYQPFAITLNNLIEKSLDIKLLPKEIILAPVTIEGNRTALSSIEKFSRGVYRPSVPSDPNQYLLDGGRVYNPSHFGGTLNTFYSETLTDVDINYGGLPPSYGGYLGGIVDYSLRNGSRQRLSGSAGIGSLNSQFSFEGPVFNRTTFLLAGRIGYPDKLMRYSSNQQIAPSNADFQEITAKVTHSVSASDLLTLSIYYGQDKCRNSVEGEWNALGNNFSWSNKLMNLRWSGIASSRLFIYASAIYSGYDFNLRHNLNDLLLQKNFLYQSTYSIEDWNINAHAENYYSEDHLLKGGAEVIYHRITTTIDPFSTQVGFYDLQKYTSLEAAIYLQDQWKMTSNLLAELGARVTSYNAKEGTFSAIDPRFSLSYLFDIQTRGYTSFSSIKQFLRPYNNSGVFVLYPSKFWYPSTDSIVPSTSLYSNVGIEHSFADDKYLFSAETYFRVTNNVYDVRIDSISFQTNNAEQFLKNGSGKAYGFQCSFRKRYGDISGSVTYLFNCLEKSFDDNKGKYAGNLFDRWHEVQLYASYSPNENWNVGTLCVITSKRKPLSTSLFGVGDEYNKKGWRDSHVPLGGNLEYSGFVDINGSRLPGFQRLEVNVSHQFAVWNFFGQITLRFLNSYGITDPYKWQLYRYMGRTRWYVLMEEVRLFPLYPAIEIAVRF